MLKYSASADFRVVPNLGMERCNYGAGRFVMGLLGWKEQEELLTQPLLTLTGVFHWDCG